ncbi:hypothetical protein THAOC_06918 [Thalassiosira oceanica]|uniref:Uncharacterized protein n=1 Tax=Thalassiosira oceanica TaxID=159749 RepID=K0T1K4_THAOC|nr:hypothetical protein THAOC_06918 [Thalassiosira oceanica]|eukprot:EJK71620.1 hypothetical protein THAOC_06918 [Thalassiosira oceanica]
MAAAPESALPGEIPKLETSRDHCDQDPPAIEGTESDGRGGETDTTAKAAASEPAPPGEIAKKRRVYSHGSNTNTLLTDGQPVRKMPRREVVPSNRTTTPKSETSHDRHDQSPPAADEAGSDGRGGEFDPAAMAAASEPALPGEKTDQLNGSRSTSSMHEALWRERNGNINFGASSPSNYDSSSLTYAKLDDVMSIGKALGSSFRGHNPVWTDNGQPHRNRNSESIHLTSALHTAKREKQLDDDIDAILMPVRNTTPGLLSPLLSSTLHTAGRDTQLDDDIDASQEPNYQTVHLQSDDSALPGLCGLGCRVLVGYDTELHVPTLPSFPRSASFAVGENNELVVHLSTKRHECLNFLPGSPSFVGEADFPESLSGLVGVIKDTESLHADILSTNGSDLHLPALKFPSAEDLMRNQEDSCALDAHFNSIMGQYRMLLVLSAVLRECAAKYEGTAGGNEDATKPTRSDPSDQTDVCRAPAKLDSPKESDDDDSESGERKDRKPSSRGKSPRAASSKGRSANVATKKAPKDAPAKKRTAAVAALAAISETRVRELDTSEEESEGGSDDEEENYVYGAKNGHNL